jgi:hypothetical protein
MTRKVLTALRPPKVGTKGVYRPLTLRGPSDGRAMEFTVNRVEGNLCYCTYHLPDFDQDSVFIWWFKDGPNILHDWEGKET